MLINDVPIECINHAAIVYHVPASIIVSVLKTEGGRNGEASRNKDGSYDYGPMQINGCWLEKIAPFGYTKYDLQYNPCKNVAVGAWILATSIANSLTEGKTIAEGVGNYHSHTHYLNKTYMIKVKNYHDWLSGIINGKKSLLQRKVKNQK